MSRLEGRLPRVLPHIRSPRPRCCAQRGLSQRERFLSLGQLGAGWGQVGTGGLRPQQVLFPSTAKMASSAPCCRHVPHWARQGTPQDRNSHLPKVPSAVSSEQTWAPSHTPRPGNSEPGKRRQDTGRARAGVRAEPSCGRATAAQRVHFTARGGRGRSPRTRTAAVPSPASEARTVSRVTGTGRRAGPPGCPHAEPRLVGVGPTGLPRGVTPGGAPGQAAGRQRKALKRRVADVGVHQGGPWGQGRRPSRRARLSRGRARGPVGQVPVGLLVPQS